MYIKKSLDYIVDIEFFILYKKISNKRRRIFSWRKFLEMLRCTVCIQHRFMNNFNSSSLSFTVHVCYLANNVKPTCAAAFIVFVTSSLVQCLLAPNINIGVSQHVSQNKLIYCINKYGRSCANIESSPVLRISCIINEVCIFRSDRK